MTNKADIRPFSSWLSDLAEEAKGKSKGKTPEQDIHYRVKIFRDKHPEIYAIFEKHYNEIHKENAGLKKKIEELEIRCAELEDKCMETLDYKAESAAWEQKCDELKKDYEKLQQEYNKSQEEYDKLKKFIEDSGYPTK